MIPIIYDPKVALPIIAIGLLGLALTAISYIEFPRKS